MDNLDFSKYFEKKEKKPKKSKKKLRKKFAIAACCGNCKNFWYRDSMERRGWCKLDDQTFNMPTSTRDKEAADKHWTRVHITTVCKAHEFRKNLDPIKNWVGEELDGKDN